MASKKRQQEVAAERVAHLDPSDIKCRFCGEPTASSPGWKGYAHRWGPHHGHAFIAANPQTAKGRQVVGTSHFRSRLEAQTYFETCSEDEVDEKINRGEIHIGKPAPFGEEWKVEIRVSEGRYLQIREEWR